MSKGKLTKEQLFMQDKCEEFKDFVLDSMSEGHHLDFVDHFRFMEACFETWIGMNLEEEV